MPVRLARLGCMRPRHRSRFSVTSAMSGLLAKNTYRQKTRRCELRGYFIVGIFIAFDVSTRPVPGAEMAKPPELLAPRASGYRASGAARVEFLSRPIVRQNPALEDEKLAVRPSPISHFLAQKQPPSRSRARKVHVLRV